MIGAPDSVERSTLARGGRAGDLTAVEGPKLVRYAGSMSVQAPGVPGLREQVRTALARHLGLDIPAASDGATGGGAF